LEVRTLKVVSRYCDSCGIKIPAQDIKDEVALEFEGSYYCKDCKEDILPLIEKSKKKARKAAPATARPRKKAAAKVKKQARKAVSRESREKKRPVKKRRVPAKAVRRRVEEIEEEEEDVEEERFVPAKRSTFPVVPAAIVGGCVLILLILLLIIASSSDPGVQQGQQPVISEEQKLEEEYAKLFKAAEDYAAKNPNEYKEIIARFDEVRRKAYYYSWGEKAEKKIREIKEQMMEDAKNAYTRLHDKAEELKAQGEYIAAIKVFDKFPVDLRRTGWYTKDVMKDIELLKKQLAAQEEAEPLLKRARDLAGEGKYAYAIGVLSGFSERHSNSPWFDRIRSLRLNYESKRADRDIMEDEAAELAKVKAEEEKRKKEEEERRKKEEALIASLPWTPLLGTDLFNWTLRSQNGDWKIKNKELQGTNSTQRVCFIGTGSKEWQNYLVKFKFKVVKGSFQLAVRFVVVRGRFPSYVTLSIDNCTGRTNEWHEALISIRGSEFKQTIDAKTSDVPASGSSTAGGIGFMLAPGGEVHFTDINVKVIGKKTK
jgi:hypothetical protein